MKNNLAQSFTAKTLIKFVMPTMVMMVFTALYQMVDGLFVSNFVGADGLSAINIVFPAISVLIGVAVMLATGGSAVVAMNMGEGNNQMAKENFSAIVLAGGLFGILISLGSLCFFEPLLQLLGASGTILPHARDYLLPIMICAPFAVLQMIFQAFFVTAGKPKLGLSLILLGGFSNIIFDALFVAAFGWGARGAAIATAIGYTIPGLMGLLYFLLRRHGTLYLVKPIFRPRVLLRSCGNGASEMVTNLANAVSTFLFNYIMLSRVGSDGVAAITIVLYSQFLLTSAFMGFSGGVAPIFSYHYGAGNRFELQKLYRICMRFTLWLSGAVFLLSLLLHKPMISVFTRPGSPVYLLAEPGFLLYSGAFLFGGLNIFASGFFTAFSDGKTSAIISLMRTFVLFIVCIIVMPWLLGLPGVWLAVPVAELLTVFISIWYLRKKRHVFGYGA